MVNEEGDEGLVLELGDEAFKDSHFIDKCLFGSALDDSRWDSCYELAKRCRTRLNSDFNVEGRNTYRQQLIDEIVTENELTDTIIEIPYADPNITPKKFRLPARLPSLFDWGYDIDKYIKKHRETSLGVCALSLYGLETAFQEEIGEMPFQSRRYAKIIHDSEKIIFDENAGVVKHVFNMVQHWDGLNENSRMRIIDVLGIDGETDWSLPSFTEDDIGKIEAYVRKIEPHTEEIIFGGNDRDFIFDRCDPLDLNPFISDKKKYLFCTEVNLNDQQNLVIKKREITIEGMPTGTWDELRRLVMKDVWRATPDHTKEEILLDVIKESPDTFETMDMNKLILSNYDNYTRTQRAEILSIYQNNFSHDELVALTIDIPEESQYKEAPGGRLDCYHHFWQYAKHPSVAYQEFIKLEMAFNVGDINKEEFTKMIEDLKYNTEIMNTKLIEPGQMPAELRKLYTKKTKYIPLRYRVWASQAYLNKIFHSTNYWYSLKQAREEGGNTYMLDTIETALGDDAIGMKERKIYGEEMMSFLATIPTNIDDGDIWDVISITSKEYIEEYIGENIWEIVTSDAYESDFEELMDIIGQTHGDFETINYAVAIDRSIDPATDLFTSDDEPITVLSGTLDDWEDAWDELDPTEYMKIINEKWESLTKEQVLYIMERDIHSPPPYQQTFTWDVDFEGVMNYGDLEKVAISYSDELSAYIDDVTEIQIARMKIKELLTSIAGEYGYMTYWDLLHDLKLEQEQGHDTSTIIKILENRGYKEGVNY